MGYKEEIIWEINMDMIPAINKILSIFLILTFAFNKFEEIVVE